MITNSMFGFGVMSLGVLGVIISLTIPNRRRFWAALVLSGVILVMGGGFLANTSLREWRTARRIAKIREANRKTLDEYRRRVQAMETAATPASKNTVTTDRSVGSPASANTRSARPSRADRR